MDILTGAAKKLTAKEAADRAEIERLRSKHQLYELYYPQWEFFLSAYEGGQSFVTEDNIHRHPREHVDDYKERLVRAHYLNYCEPLVDFFTAFIFAETIQRNGGSNADWYNEFIKDVNRKGEDVTSFMQQGSDDKQIFGMVYVLVDAPRVDPGEMISKAKADQMGIRPYWVLVRPEEVFDWVSDEFDKYTYWKRRQDLEIGNSSNKQCIERYYEWTPDEISMTDIDVTNPNKPILKKPVITPNQLGEIPVVLMRYKRSKKYRFMGQSFLVDLAYNNREVMNLTSLLQEFLYRQAFNILAVQTDFNLPVANQTEGQVSTANLMQYPKGADAPSYIAPSADPAKFIQEERQRIVQEMYKRAAQDTVNELFNGTKSSGFSKAQSFSTTVPKIATRADVLEKAENRLMELTMKYVDKKWDGKIKYKDRYELTNISDALSQMTSLFKDLQMPSETFVKQELKRMVHEFDGKIPLDEMTTIEAEIDAMDFAEWQDIQRLAFIGKAAMAPEAALAFQDDKGNTTQLSNDNKQKAPSAKVKPQRKPSTSTELASESSKK
jgi:hypothetical protein